MNSLTNEDIAMRFSTLLLGTLLAMASAVASAIDSRLTYQGSLEESGLPAEGAYDFRFTLQDEQGTAMAPLHMVDTVPVTGGVFTVELDFGPGAFLGEDRFLRIELRPNGSAEPYTALDPPARITPVPYAQTALGAHVAASVAENGVDGAAIIDGSIKAADIDAAQVQRRVTGTCAANRSVLGVEQDGTVICSPAMWTNEGKGLVTYNFVGIGTEVPENSLHVTGYARVSRLSAGTSASPLYPLDTTIARVATRMGVGTPPNSAYAIDAVGAVRLQNTLEVGGTVRSGAIGLIKGPGATMQRMYRAQVTLAVTNLAAGASADSSDFTFPAGRFSAPPIVMMGQLVSASGAEGARVQFVPFNTRANATQFRVFNQSSAPITVTATYEFMAIGPE
jgi:hypothetical protein